MFLMSSYRNPLNSASCGIYPEHPMDELKNLQSMWLTLPSPAYLIGAILFGIIGFAAYRYGKKASDIVVKWGGIVLLLYPYALSETWQLYAAGLGLCVGIYILRR